MVATEAAVRDDAAFLAIIGQPRNSHIHSQPAAAHVQDVVARAAAVAAEEQRRLDHLLHTIDRSDARARRRSFASAAARRLCPAHTAGGPRFVGQSTPWPSAAMAGRGRPKPARAAPRGSTPCATHSDVDTDRWSQVLRARGRGPSLCHVVNSRPFPRPFDGSTTQELLPATAAAALYAEQLVTSVIVRGTIASALHPADAARRSTARPKLALFQSLWARRRSVLCSTYSGSPNVCCPIGPSSWLTTATQVRLGVHPEDLPLHVRVHPRSRKAASKSASPHRRAVEFTTRSKRPVCQSPYSDRRRVAFCQVEETIGGGCRR